MTRTQTTMIIYPEEVPAPFYEVVAPDDPLREILQNATIEDIVSIQDLLRKAQYILHFRVFDNERGRETFSVKIDQDLHDTPWYPIR